MAFVTLANEILSFLVLAVLLGLIYRVLPDADLEWKDVGLGAVVTALLFSIGKRPTASISRGRPRRRSSGCGSLVVVLLWI